MDFEGEHGSDVFADDLPLSSSSLARHCAGRQSSRVHGGWDARVIWPGGVWRGLVPGHPGAFHIIII